MFAIFVLLLLGAITPVLLFFGPIVYLFSVPFTSAFALLYPKWQRLPPDTRRKIVKTVIWALSLSLWFYTMVQVAS